MRGKEAVAAILADNHGVIRMREHRSLRSTVWRLAKSGYLRREFPGVYVRASTADNSHQWLAALSAWKPDAVVTGEVAFALATKQLPPTVSQLPPVVLHRSRETRKSSRCRFKHRAIDPEQVSIVAGIRVHHPAAAAVEAAESDSGEAIDHLLREARLDPAELTAIATIHRHCPGNARRAVVVAESQARPFSIGERAVHRLLTRAGITGWVANQPLRLFGRTVIPDVLFPEARVVLEFDGREFHVDRFESDRDRQNVIASDGYIVLRVTWDMVKSRPAALVATIRRTLANALARNRPAFR